MGSHTSHNGVWAFVYNEQFVSVYECPYMIGVIYYYYDSRNIACGILIKKNEQEKRNENKKNIIPNNSRNLSTRINDG